MHEYSFGMLYNDDVNKASQIHLSNILHILIVRDT
jgi:hypothetical protein